MLMNTTLKMQGALLSPFIPQIVVAKMVIGTNTVLHIFSYFLSDRFFHRTFSPTLFASVCVRPQAQSHCTVENETNPMIQLYSALTRSDICPYENAKMLSCAQPQLAPPQAITHSYSNVSSQTHTHTHIRALTR